MQLQLKGLLFRRAESASRASALSADADIRARWLDLPLWGRGQRDVPVEAGTSRGTRPRCRRHHSYRRWAVVRRIHLRRALDYADVVRVIPEVGGPPEAVVALGRLFRSLPSETGGCTFLTLLRKLVDPFHSSLLWCRLLMLSRSVY